MRNTTAEIINTTDLQDSVLNAMACVIGQNLDLPAGRVMQSAMQGTLIHQVRDFYSRHPEMRALPLGEVAQ
ncbi:hypothetical protein [Plesiomonas shigelloides]|uniref:hypothetical protein n=1 Tax=Plesiomonas shigelloides TaxID=703 RepID=UPI0012614B01|nr:hypothetical protein [Plesiomonas shigelloides]KAB7671917.1 hypothetical protein GBN18_01185 [Plesiomonas shigelloides]